jgi:hypothetical protein
VKPLFRYLIRTCNILGMCCLQISPETFKMGERVARKLFATIRYRFSHLDNGLIWKTARGQVGPSGTTLKLLKNLTLTVDSRLSLDTLVPVVVAD